MIITTQFESLWIKIIPAIVLISSDVITSLLCPLIGESREKFRRENVSRKNKNKRKLEQGEMQGRELNLLVAWRIPFASDSFSSCRFFKWSATLMRTPYYTRPGRFFPLRQPVRVSMIVLAIANLQETLSLFLFLCHSTLSSREWRPLRDEDLLLVLHVLTIVQSRKLMARLLKNTQPITGFFSGTTILEGIKKTSGSRRAKYMEDTDWKISRGWWIRLMVAKGTV